MSQNYSYEVRVALQSTSKLDAPVMETIFNEQKFRDHLRRVVEDSCLALPMGAVPPGKQYPALVFNISKVVVTEL